MRESLGNITIPNSVTTIGGHAFAGCRSLTNIAIPSSVTSIDGFAFDGCVSLTNITIPDSVTSIGGWAFHNCSSLQSITIPDSVTSVCENSDWDTFDGCNNLTINASIEWKTKHYGCHSSLYKYRPQPQQSNSGCYIATAIYGSYDCPSVWILRRYRDNRLAKSFLGRTFIRCYYAVSPTVVCIFGKKKWFNRFWKKRLDKFVIKLQDAGYEDSPYTDC